MVSKAATHLTIDCLNPAVNSRPAVLLVHGWGASSDIWQACTQDLAKAFALYAVDLPGHGKHAHLTTVSLIEFVNELAKQMPIKNFSIIGWSLGGLVGSLLAAQSSSRVTALVTIASNQSFVVQPTWPSAMASHEFESFFSTLSLSSLARQMARFQVLQTQGVDSAKQDFRHIKTLLEAVDFSLEGLQSGLAALKESDLHDCWQCLSMPVLHQFGQHDTLVPVSACRAIAKCHPHHSYQVFRHSAHLPFISEMVQWQFDTEQFLNQVLQDQVIDKKVIADSFSNAVDDYDALADFQHQAGLQLLQLMPVESVARLADLGSGTGYFSGVLRDNYPLADIIEVDLSAKMLVHAKQYRECISPQKNLPLNTLQVQSDIEQLPFQVASIDLIFSNLSIQWCADLDRLFSQLASSLVMGGQAFLSTLIEGSLFELKFAWSMADAGVHVNRFSAISALKASCERAGLTLNICHSVDHVQHFDDLPSLLRSVKKIGAHNMNPQRSKGLLGKNKYQRFVDAFEDFKTGQNQYPLTYRVVFLVITKNA
jgi:malonyl-CoA O-methyltransferase